jgi:hypothetical protein
MCCFSGNVDVSNTKIFARFMGKQSQAVVYQMHYRATEPVAMVLPIPTPPKSPEDAVKFISLKDYKTFFADLHKGFPVPPSKSRFGTFGEPAAKDDLKVIEVGDFIASFVPTVADFDRLDVKFRLPSAAWDKLPKQKTYGFAVFQLKKDATETHPMAFTFPTRPKHDLFFPTVHIHDGEVHEMADFDHVLYLQPRSEDDMPPRQWEESAQPAGMFTNQRESQGLLEPDLHIYRRKLVGKLKNADLIV